MSFSIGDRIFASQTPLPRGPRQPAPAAPPKVVRPAQPPAHPWEPLPQRCPPPRLPRIPHDFPQTSSPVSSPPQSQRILLVGGWLVALFTVAMNLGVSQSGGVNTRSVNARAINPTLCQTVVQPNAALSRQQLIQVLTVPERSSQAKIREQLAQPYCQLPELEVRAGVHAQREAYPLAFDPQTWLVLLFEEEEYAGYAFQFQS